MNFHAGKLHVWLVGTNNIVVATRPTVPRAWTHYAITRDAGGIFRLYVNGELDATGAKANPAVLEGLDVGRVTAPKAGTAGWLAEYRVWTVARPAGLAHAFTGAALGAVGSNGARAADRGFAGAAHRGGSRGADGKVRAIPHARQRARKPRSEPRTLHGAVPDLPPAGRQRRRDRAALDGLGLVGVDALLRNLLTPGAARESAYRIFRVVTREGRVQEGFLVEENVDTLLLRRPGAEDRRIRRSDIRSSGYLPRSLMPEGLLELLGEAQVSDLFAHLKSLR